MNAISAANIPFRQIHALILYSTTLPVAEARAKPSKLIHPVRLLEKCKTAHSNSYSSECDREPSLRESLIIQSLPIENWLYTFFDSGLPSFGLFGCRKMKNVSPLPSRRQRIKGSFQGRDFV